jgi:cytoskeletal protein RodZ
VKPQERDELAKHREFEAINARLAQHDRKVQVTLLVVVLLNVVILALLAYILFGRN